jgi:hypothetical protein
VLHLETVNGRTGEAEMNGPELAKARIGETEMDKWVTNAFSPFLPFSVSPIHYQFLSV